MKLQPVAVFTVLLCLLITVQSRAIERRRGYVRETQVLTCLNRCDFYNLQPDSSFTFVYLKPDQFTPIDLNAYVGMHVEITGYLSGCGGCSVFYIQTILRLSTDGADDNPEMPLSPSLQQNYPNPFNPSTTIEYVLNREASITLTVFDILGREVTRLAALRQHAGLHDVAWDASGRPGGVYFYVLRVHTGSGGEVVQTKAMLLVR